MKRFSTFLLMILFVTGCGQKSDTAWEQSKPKSLSGKITILPELQAKVNQGDVLFVMAKGESGPPIAVKRMTITSFPITYSLTEESDLMMPGMIFPEKMYVSVRIDKDGNASRPQPGDLGGEYPNNPAPVGKSDIDIEINQLY